MSLEDRIVALIEAIGRDISSLNQNGSLNPNYITINFGTQPINEKNIVVFDQLCTINSKIDISQIFISQREENFGVKLDLFIETQDGYFTVNAISTEPFSKGIFNLKYIIL